MTQAPHKRSPKPDVFSSVRVKLGRWFEASASGWGVLALPGILLLLFAALARLLPSL